MHNLIKQRVLINLKLLEKRSRKGLVKVYCSFFFFGRGNFSFGQRRFIFAESAFFNSFKHYTVLMCSFLKFLHFLCQLAFLGFGT
jgi:hypothetical protein